MREKLTLFSNGYVYHPRFLLFHAEVSGALKQEWFEASYLPPFDRRQDDGLEYEFRVVLLPEHSYNLELFALRYEPLLKEQWSARRNSINTSYGADFRYRKRPYFFHSRYSEESVDSEETRTDVSRLGIDGQYYKDFAGGRIFSVDAAFNPSRFESSYGVSGETSEARAGSLVDLGRYRLDSSVTWTRNSQGTDSRDDLESEQLAWYERFTALLPHHLRAELAYRYLDSETTLPAGAAGRRRFSTESRYLDLDLIHQLYRSLQTTYSARLADQSSPGGESSSVGHSLSFNYTKEIPGGRLIANLGGSRVESENRGRLDVVEEGHPATQIPGSFVLARQNIERGSLRVSLRSPLPPNEMIELTEGVHYALAEVGAGLELTVYSLPPQFVVPGTYEIRVSYVLAGGNFELRMDTVTHGASLELFDQRLTPYYSYSELRSRVLSGQYGGGSLDSSTLTAGLIFRWRRFRALAEYQKVEWQVSPYESWRGELQLAGDLGPTASYYATVSHRLRTFPEGRQGLARGEYDEKTSSAAGSIQKQLFSRRLILSLGGSYSRLDGLVVNDAYSITGSASWKLGRLDLTLGASVFDTETEGPLLIASRRSHQYYYLKLRRQLF